MRQRQFPAVQESSILDVDASGRERRHDLAWMSGPLAAAPVPEHNRGDESFEVAATSGLRIVADRPSGVEVRIDLPVDIANEAAQYAASRLGYRRAKRSLDIALAATGLVVCAPLIALLAMLIRIDSPGPIFFRQARVGEGGRLFTILKLRSMRAEEDDGLNDGADLDPDADRITRAGHYLRRWSLDEIPQLLNVLRGEMSLVGPRPERPEIVRSMYERWQYQRFLAPQGMTGWWQVTDRGRTRLCDDTTDDLYYLDRASFGFDLKILLMTVPAVARHAGAR